jgi:hypothetical protein
VGGCVDKVGGCGLRRAGQMLGKMKKIRANTSQNTLHFTSIFDKNSVIHFNI